MSSQICKVIPKHQLGNVISPDTSGKQKKLPRKRFKEADPTTIEYSHNRATIIKHQGGGQAASPGKPAQFAHYNVPVGSKGEKLKKKITKHQAGGRVRPTLLIGDAPLRYSNKEIYNKINPEVAYDASGFADAGIRYAWAPGDRPRTGKNLASPEEEAYWKKYLTGENTKGIVEPTTNRINYDKGDTTSEFVGIPNTMMERVAAMADTLSLGKLVRDPGMYKKAFPKGNMTPEDLKENYEFAKKVMNNPGIGQRASERMTLKEGVKPYTSGLGALQNFGMVWDKNKGVVKAYDTYNFPSELSLWLPGRKRELKLRGEIPFNPKVGSTLLKNNFEQYDTIK